MENRKLTYSLMKQSKGHFILYVTFSDLNKLEPEVQDHEEFESLKKFLESNGFLHMLMMAFRSNSHKLKVKDIVEIMKEGGYERNKSVENFLKSHLKEQKSMAEREKKDIKVLNFDTDITQIPSFDNSQNAIYTNTSIPRSLLESNTGLSITHSSRPAPSELLKVGHTVELCLYLFIKTKTDESFRFDFDYGFSSRHNNGERRFIKHAMIPFERIELNEKGVMRLQSIMSARDILKEIEYTYYISIFDAAAVLNGERPRPITYNAIEFKDFLNLNSHIVMDINDKDFVKLLSMSEKVRKEKSEYDRGTLIPTSNLKETSLDILKRMDSRMKDMSAAEEYESAAEYKKNKEFIESKIKLASELEESGIKQLNSDFLEKYFCLRDLSF